MPGGLRNVVGTVPGRERGFVVLGAHYDTKDIPGFVGANDGASGTAIVTQIARQIKRPRRTIEFILFDGEESPRGTPDSEFEEEGLRGSKAAAPVLPRRAGHGAARLRGRPPAADPARGLLEPGRSGAACGPPPAGWAPQRIFPDDNQGSVLDDHIPFLEEGVPAIDLIDFAFPCFHRRCDDLSAVSARSVDAVGETVYELMRTL